MAERGIGGADRPPELSVGSLRDGPRPEDLGGEVMAAPVPRHRWWRVAGAIVVLAVAFLIGWGAGYDQGYQAAPSEEPDLPAVTDPGAPAPTGGAVAGLRPTGELCAVQVGARLWLGIELMNAGPGSVVLRRVRVTLPLGGLDDTSLLLGACGQLDALDARVDAGRDPDATVRESATAWVSGIFDVLEDCPAPYPVQFLVDYTDPTGGGYAVASGSFPDLGAVDYSRC